MEPDKDRPANDETKRTPVITHNRDRNRPSTSSRLDRGRKAGTADLIAAIVAALGHTVIAQEIEVDDVGAVTAPATKV